jgi:hypothetical protein
LCVPVVLAAIPQELDELQCQEAVGGVGVGAVEERLELGPVAGAGEQQRVVDAGHAEHDPAPFRADRARCAAEDAALAVADELGRAVVDEGRAVGSLERRVTDEAGGGVEQAPEELLLEQALLHAVRLLGEVGEVAEDRYQVGDVLRTHPDLVDRAHGGDARGRSERQAVGLAAVTHQAVAVHDRGLRLDGRRGHEAVVGHAQHRHGGVPLRQAVRAEVETAAGRAVTSEVVGHFKGPVDGAHTAGIGGGRDGERGRAIAE